MKIYLDDVRTPIESDWIVVRNYDDFVAKVNEIGLENIETISLDHDLDPSAMIEWSKNTFATYTINYDNIKEKTGFDCAKWLIKRWEEGNPVVKVVIHSANAIGSANMMGVINHYKHTKRLPQDCIRVNIEHTIDQTYEK